MGFLPSSSLPLSRSQSCQQMHYSDRFERPTNFWLRARPSPLVLTLALNMESAARKAYHSGRFDEAGAKYHRAAQYLEHSATLYGDDREMFM
mmetsp:Transcript_30409/g.98232  ORF Transcript_30409/g.98232 Transcript_30409/m.98232 type:complete len:92 (-) Transcript_30409:451-726(-)|eukprot:scaffold21778_cov131-Isochrysis_galbana.AAC.13